MDSEETPHLMMKRPSVRKWAGKILYKIERQKEDGISPFGYTNWNNMPSETDSEETPHLVMKRPSVIKWAGKIKRQKEENVTLWTHKLEQLAQ